MQHTAPLALAALLCAANSTAQQVVVAIDRNDLRHADGSFTFATVPSPSQDDAATGARFMAVDGDRDTMGGELSTLHDGALPADRDQPSANFFFAAGTDGGRFVVDLHRRIDVERIGSYSWHRDTRGPQVYSLFAGEGTEPGFTRRPKRGTDPTSCGWRLLALVDTRPKDGEVGGQFGVDIHAATGTLGKFRYLLFDVQRTEDQDAFGNTFFSEIDVIDHDAPAPPAASGGVQTIPIDGGRYEVLVDTSQSGDLDRWVREDLIPVVTDWYPKIVAMLPSEGFEAPKKFTITFDESMKGVAATGGTNIGCGSAWFRDNLKGEAVGAVLHEMVHVVQQYRRGRRSNPNGGRAPGWLTEGIPDYIRWYLYEPQSRGAEIRTARRLAAAKHDGSYRVSANFLDYVVRNHDEDIIAAMNAACRRAEYRDELWEERTQKTLAELDGLWKASLAEVIAQDAAANTLTDAERAAGWQLLFNGTDFDGWHNFKSEGVRKGWQVEHGAMVCVDPHQAGDLVTAEAFDWFELQLDYLIAPGGNSGIMFRVTDQGGAAWATGPEFQLEDNERAADPTRCGWLYGLYQPPDDPKTGKPLDATKPAGEWNHVRLLIAPQGCVHEINGVTYFEYVLGSDDFAARVAKSKFRRMPDFAKAAAGSIALQGDHGQIRFRNLKVRRIAREGQ